MKRPLQPLLLVALGTALVACSYGLVRYAFGLSVPAAQRDLGLSTTAAGLVSGGTSVAYCVAAGLASLTCERWPRAVVAAAGVVTAGGALGAGLATGAGTFAASVVVGSAGAGAVSPALVVLVRRAVPGPAGDGLQGVVNSGTGPGLVLAGVLALAVGPEWQRAWVAAALVSAVVAAALLLVSPGPVAGTPTTRVRVDVSAAWWAPVGAAVLLGLGSGVVWTYGRAALERGGLSPDRAVLVWVCLGLGASATAVVGPALVRRGVPTAWRVSVLLAALGTGALGVGALPWVAAAVFGLGFTAGTGVLIAWADRVSTTPGPAVAALFTALLLGQAVGAPAAGAVLAHGPAAAFLPAALVVLGAAPLARAGRARPVVQPPTVDTSRKCVTSGNGS